MNDSQVSLRLDRGIRFFLYSILFWLPYSPAFIETSVGLAILLWLIKHGYHFWVNRTSGRSWWSFFSVPNTFLNKPIAYFLAACLLSILSAVLWQDALKGFFAKTLEWFVVFFLVVEVLTHKRHIQMAMIVLLFSAAAVLLDGFVQLITHRDIFFGHLFIDDRINASFKDPNSFAGYLLFIFFIVYMKLFEKQPLHNKIFWGLFLTATIVTLVLTYSRSAWVGMAAASIFMLIASHEKVKWRNILVILIILTGLSVMGHRELRARAGINAQSFSGSAGWRVDVWSDSFKAIKEKPLYGHGLNTFMRLLPSYRARPEGMTYAHNCYIQMTVEIGFIGLLAFLFLMSQLFIQTLRRWRQSSQKSGIEVALLSGIFGFLIQGFFEVNFYSLQLSILWWLATGILVAAGQIGKEPLNFKKG